MSKDTAPRTSSAVLLLQARRAPRLPFYRCMSRRSGKELAMLQVRFAQAGVELHRIEGDGGLEELVITRGAMTVRFLTRSEAGAWLEAEHATV